MIMFWVLLLNNYIDNTIHLILNEKHLDYFFSFSSFLNRYLLSVKLLDKKEFRNSFCSMHQLRVSGMIYSTELLLSAASAFLVKAE